MIGYKNKLRKKNLTGLNVTIPYKVEIMPFLDKIDKTALTIGAVNTIRITKKGKLKPTIYTTNDGLAGSVTGASKAVKTKDGWMAFPTLQGVSFINPSYIQLDHHEPKVYIEKISLDGTVVEYIKDGEHIEILPEAHHIKISYTALSYRTPQKTVFKYRLFPFEKEWVETNLREVSYTSLPIGKYTFQLTASNGDGIWNENKLEIQLEQKGYFYGNVSDTIIYDSIKRKAKVVIN